MRLIRHEIVTRTLFAAFALIANNGSIQAAERAELWGHLRYHEAAHLASMGEAYPPQMHAGISCRLAPEVFEPLRDMLAHAYADGVKLVMASCYRSADTQIDLFFAPPDAPAPKSLEDMQKIAYTSAPPGFSEHHTGYAVDFCDGAVPATCSRFDMGFSNTAAGRWLVVNGERFGFELSFPSKDDSCVKKSGRTPQGVAFEPWHWRFAGSADAGALFARAHERFAVCPAPARIVMVPRDGLAEREDPVHNLVRAVLLFWNILTEQR